MDVLTKLLELIEKIPATFWGIAIGSFFSLSGVALTNRANDRRLRAQLTHDRDMKTREREQSLRKDIYLAAAEAISAGLLAIGRFPNLDIPNDKLTDPYTDKTPSIAKVHVIATEETTKAVANFVGELSAAYLRLLTKRYPLIAEKGQITVMKGLLDSFGAVRDRMVELMRQFNLDGKTDQQQFAAIQRNFDFEQHRIAETVQEHDTRAAILYSRQIEYMKECIAESNRLSRLLVPVVVAVRKELELPINEVAYMGVIEGSIKKQEASLEKFVQDIQRFTAPNPSPPGDVPQ